VADEGLFGSARRVAYAPDGERLAGGSADGSVRIWDVRTGRLSTTLSAHTDMVAALAWSPDGRFLASASLDGSVRGWEAGPGRADDWRMRVMPHVTGQAAAVAFSPDGRLLAGGCLDRRVLVWDTATDELVHTLMLPAGVLATTFHPDGHTLATGSLDETVVEWDVRTGMKQRVAIRHNDVVYAVAYSAQGDLLASGGGDGAVFVRRTGARRARQQRLDSTDPTRRPAHQWVQTWTVGFSPDGSTVAGGTDDGRLLIWNPHTQHRLRTERHGTPITGLAYSPDGSTLVVADTSETVSLFDGRTGAPKTQAR